MIKFMFKTGIVAIIVTGIAATGVQFDEKKIENDGLRLAATGWNRAATALHNYVVENEDDIIAKSRELAGDAAEKAVDAASAIGRYAEENKDDIRDMAESAGENIAETISDN